MLLSFAALVLIILITLYLATQGAVSAFLALVTATFASLLAMGLLEACLSPIAGFRPDYARGVTFLLLFFVAFAICRVAADVAVPKNIRMMTLVDRLIGGFLGFFAALVVIGTTVIGIEMMPLPRPLLGDKPFGYDRFPYDRVMQGDGPGVVASQSNIWLLPDRFTLALWEGASGRALGGRQAWSQVHPDLSVESYGYRNFVQEGTSRTIPRDLFSLAGAWMSADPKDVQGLGIAVDSGKRIVMVRTQVKKGDKPPHESMDPDNLFRMTATQVRLVTDKARQYYPIGHLWWFPDPAAPSGRVYRFESLPLDSGHLIEDPVSSAVIDDWVFEINDEERPVTVEMKQLARGNVAAIVKDLGDKDLKAWERAAATQPSPDEARKYPKVAYRYEGSHLQVTVALPAAAGPLSEGKVYVIVPALPQREAVDAMRGAYDFADGIVQGRTTWPAAGKPGVPSVTDFQSARRIAQDVINAPKEQVFGWNQLIRPLLLAQTSADGDQNLRIVSAYITDKLQPLWEHVSTGSVIRATGVLNPDGKAELTQIPSGKLAVFVTAKADKGFYVWVEEQEFTPNSLAEVSLNVDHAQFRLDLQPSP